MFDKIKKWWTRDQRLDQLELTLRDLVNAKIDAETKAAQADEKIAAQQAEIDSFKAAKEAEELRKNGKDPYVEIRSADYNAERGIQIELDWNDAFIALLRENGINGKTDDIIIQKWLSVLYDDLISRIDSASIEELSQNKPSEFE